MKKIIVLLLFISSFSYAQFTIKGTLTPNINSDWAILYKVEGARQSYIQNTKIVKDSIVVEGKKLAIGNLEFTLPESTKPGFYRITYRLEGAGFADFIFNKENVSFTLHPDYPEQSISFSESQENILYQQYLGAISNAQQTIDSIQIAAIRNPNKNQKKVYKQAVNNVNIIQQDYLKASINMYALPFVKATFRKNPKELSASGQQYMQYMTTTFFDNMNFEDITLLNSSFLVDRITDYVFYINFSEDETAQQNLYKQSVDTVLAKISDPNFKKDIIEFLVNQFEDTKNVVLIDYLFEGHYSKLPYAFQNKKFKQEKLANMVSEIGRIAPNFSWKENGKEMQLHQLNESQHYVLVFWSTDCSHCLVEIPKLHSFLKDKTNIKVVAFSLERNDFAWKNMQKNLQNWHHILGLNKWENKIARIYNINATPSYLVLNAKKEIIAKPDKLIDVKKFINEL